MVHQTLLTGSYLTRQDKWHNGPELALAGPSILSSRTTYPIANVAATPIIALFLTFSVFSCCSKILAFFAGWSCLSLASSVLSSSSDAFRFDADELLSPSIFLASSTISFAFAIIASGLSGKGSSAEPEGISILTFVVVVSVLPCFSTFDSTSTLTFSPSIDSEGAIEAASSRAACNEALASLALIASASFAALVARGFLCDFAGLAFLTGEAPLGLPRDLGVDARPETPFGGGRCGLSLAVNLYFGGGDIEVFGSSVVCGIGVSSSRARIQPCIPYA